MPKATRATDRRRTGRAKRVTGVVGEQANMQDQRTKGQYSPSGPSASSEFKTGITVGKPMSRGVSMGKGTSRATPMTKKLGGK